MSELIPAHQTLQSHSKKQLAVSRRAALATGAAAYVLGAAPAKARAKKRYDAIVIGAGLSGLHSAMLLEEAGLDVLTLEGRNRLGGRVYTLMDVPGKPEAAGELIGGNYARMIDTARRLGLELFEPEVSLGGREKYYIIKGQKIAGEDWPDHPLNPLTGEERFIMPDRMLWTLSHKNNPLSGKPLDDWIKPEYAQYDIPHSQYMKDYLGYSDEVIRLMNVVIHTDHMDNTSALHELRRYAVNEFNSKMAKARPDLPAVQQVKGGNSLMPQKMAESLSNGVLLNKTVLAFEDTGGEVAVHCGDGSAYYASKVVCSIPFPVLRQVKFSPRLSARLSGAVAEIDYGISIQVHYAIKKEYWEEDGLPNSIWTDSPIERFAVLNRGEGGAISSAIAFINGNEAYKYDFMTDQQAYDYTTQELVKVRPSLKGALEPLMVQSCHRNVHGAGDWVFWRPGQIQDYAPYMREAHGNIHFAGEHTALLERGMEGAFESGERAAFDVLEQL
ncbi:MAG: FAD-dependent oxidoreductase [Pseudomonadota bacterium]